MPKVLEAPRGAMSFSSEMEVKATTPGAKTAPVQFVARTSQPINHPWWLKNFGGPVVHDFAGMSAKAKVSIDYEHDDPIGYANKFSVMDLQVGDQKMPCLTVSGAIIPDDEVGADVLKKAKFGIPYEASIDFDGDGIEVEPVAEGEVVDVNGGKFTGPGAVVRKWPLRGVAVCRRGADGNTAAKFGANEIANVTVITKEVSVSSYSSQSDSTSTRESTLKDERKAGEDLEGAAGAAGQAGAVQAEEKGDETGIQAVTPAIEFTKKKTSEPEPSCQTAQAELAAKGTESGKLAASGGAAPETPATLVTPQKKKEGAEVKKTVEAPKADEDAAKATKLQAQEVAQQAAVEPGSEQTGEQAAGTSGAAAVAAGASAGKLVAGPVTDGKRFLACFGDKGGVWFAQGISFDKAQEMYHQEVEAKFKAQSDEITALKSRLSAVDRGDKGVVEFQSGESEGRTMGRTAFSNLTPGLATFAAGIKMPGHKTA
jgi:hypothetical protein